MDLNELIQNVELDGYRITVERIRTCIHCLVEGGGDYGVAINDEDKIIYISNIDVVDSDDCDFASDHLDYKVQEALKRLLESDQIRMVVEDGQIKYMRNQIMCDCFWCDQAIEHPKQHDRWVVISPIDYQPAVSCYTCGHVELYDKVKHTNLIDIGQYNKRSSRFTVLSTNRFSRSGPLRLSS